MTMGCKGCGYTPWPTKANSRFNNTLLAVGILLALNAGFVLASIFTGIDRPWINVDYAFALVLFAFGFPVLATILGLLFLFADTLSMVGSLLPFPRLSDLLYLLKFTAQASVFHFFLVVSITAIILGKLIFLVVLGRRVDRLSALIVFNIVIVLAAVLILSSYDTKDITYRKLVSPLVSSQASSFVRMRSSLFLDKYEGDDTELHPGSAGATLHWISNKNQTLHDRMLLILVESWGTAQNRDIERTLLLPLRALPNASFEQGTINANGVTVGAELRELCGLTPASFNLRNVENGFEDCLPNSLNKGGYATAAIHGATRLMYDRTHWYPRAGFKEMIFFEDRIWPRRCHSFPGACDLDMLSEVGYFFSKPDKRFMYWLTLNSHSPYDLRDLRTDNFDCAAHNIDVHTESCRMLKLQADFFAGLAEKLKDDEMRDVDIIIVGDHPPKLLDLDEANRSFATGLVPWVRIRTKS